MQTDVYRLWPSRIVTFLVCALAAASAVYWGFKIWNSSAPVPVNAPKLVVAESSLMGAPKAVIQALGGDRAAPVAVADQKSAVTSRYVLAGLVASAAQGGAALISIDGQEAKPIRVGAPVDERWVLTSVTNRRAVLSLGRDASAAKLTLELPLPPPLPPLSLGLSH